MVDGVFEITLTTAGWADQIRECRQKLDRKLARFAAPPKGMCQSLRLLGRNGMKLRYELTVRAMVGEEKHRTIL